MSYAEAQGLWTHGKNWSANVWIRGDYGQRDIYITQLNTAYGKYGFTFKRGFQQYDPVVVAPGNKHYTYEQIAGWAAGQADGGRGVAQQFVQWLGGTTVTLDDLPVQMQALAFIAMWAEVARGYGSSIELELYPWINQIANTSNKHDASALWSQYNTRFSPSLKYKQDIAMDWSAT